MQSVSCHSHPVPSLNKKGGCANVGIILNICKYSQKNTWFMLIADIKRLR